MDDLRPEDPRQIGPYWLEGRLGSGGMGNVYLGRSPGGRHVAIKVIRAELARDAEFRARFAREVTAMRKVSGIFTVAVVDADLHAPTPWLATSYVAGPSLADEVEAHGPLSPGVVLMLAAGLAEGLVAIHAAGLVHRDLKPSNVLLAEDGPRLIDFGISRSMDSSALTRTGMVMGSPGFMSPEQARGLKPGRRATSSAWARSWRSRLPVRNRSGAGPVRFCWTGWSPASRIPTTFRAGSGPWSSAA